MKTIRKIALFVALCVMAMVTVSAQEPSKVEVKVNELVKRYENVKGVESLTVTKGGGLGLVKAMFNQQFGKDFMKGVTSITVINYSEASQETCLALRNEIEQLATLLQDFKMGDEKEFAEYSYVKSLATIVGENAISDFIVAMESKDVKTIMYMSGKIKVE